MPKYSHLSGELFTNTIGLIGFLPGVIQRGRKCLTQFINYQFFGLVR